VADRITYYTIDELMAVCMARTIKDGTTVFNGVAVPLPFAAIMLARKTHAPDCVFWSGLLAGLNPDPCFLPPTSGDSSILTGADPILHLSQIFELAMRGGLDRIFFSGAQIDKHGNLNNTLIGSMDKIRVKLPGGAGASHIGAFAKNFTVWSVRHEATITAKGQRLYSFVDKVDFVTTMGLRNQAGTRKELGLRGGGPDVVVTNLCVFDFDEATMIMRLKSLHPGVTVQDVLDNTGFEPVIPAKIQETAPPSEEEIHIVRTVDPLETRKRGFSEKALQRRYSL
jgi:glutaconate CoA-transferase subunit B